MSIETKAAARGFMIAIAAVVIYCFAAIAFASGPSKKATDAASEVKRITLLQLKQKELATLARAEEAAAKTEYKRLQSWLDKNYGIIDSEGWHYDLKTDSFKQKDKAPKQEASVDLNKLAKAVALHETGDCTAKVGAALVRNCFGIRTWVNGKPQFKKYATKEESYEDFKRIWSTYYKRYPDLALAKKYSGNDRPHQWLANVSHFYETL